MYDCIGMNGLTCSNGLASVLAGFWAYTVNQTFIIDETTNNNSTNNSSSTIIKSIIIPVYQTAVCSYQFCPHDTLLQIADDHIITPDSINPINSTTAIASQCVFPRVDSPTTVLCGQCADGFVDWNGKCLCKN